MNRLRLAGTPDLLSWHQLDPEAYPVLLESSSGEGWHILMALPESIRLYSSANAATLHHDLRALELGNESRLAELPELPFRGGWFLYLGYEYLHQIEPSVLPREPDDAFPLAALMKIPAAVVQHAGSGETWLVSETGLQLHQLERDSRRVVPVVSVQLPVITLVEEAPEAFLDGVASIREYIRAGDVFQVNLSRRWHGYASQPVDPASLRLRLRDANPAPFAGLARLDATHAIVSSSPERLFSIRQGMISTRPIAGTHPRLPDAEADRQQRDALLEHPKERAEHIMLVDLERNDLGRVCQPGSVRVEELMGVSSYAWVHHIESVVTGRLQSGWQPADVVRALFPGGTITGCPKVRTMQIIRELETTPRHAYTGSMGYINRNGDMDLNILIRSMMVAGPELTFSAGAGIVADSDPQRELQETRAKARGLLRALEENG